MKDKRTLIGLRKSVEIADINPNESVLDIGCGDSYILNYLPIKTNHTGIDMNAGDVNWDLEYGIPLELKDSKFDVIFMNEFIEHIENFKSLLIHCRDMLSETGRIIISTPSSNRGLFGEDPTHIHCFRKSNMRNLANICGLQIDIISGTYLGIPYIPIISSPQTLLTGVVIYRLMKKEVS